MSLLFHIIDDNKKCLAIGDSTVAEYLGGSAIATFFDNMDSVAFAGDNINQQLTRFNAYPNKSSLDYAVIQVGLNDMNFANSLNDITARYQNLVNVVSQYCDVYVSCMIPCKARWILMYGATNGAISQDLWIGLNNWIMNNCVNVVGRISSHVALLDDGNGNLNPIYEASNDKIHTNNAGRLINANSWKSVIQ